MEKPILFTKDNCKFCELVKGHLRKHNKLDSVEVKNVSQDYEALGNANYYEIMSYPALVDTDETVYRTPEAIFKRLGI